MSLSDQVASIQEACKNIRFDLEDSQAALPLWLLYGHVKSLTEQVEQLAGVIQALLPALPENPKSDGDG